MKIAQFAKKVSLTVVAAGVVLLAIAPVKAHAASITFNATRNCDDNAVLYCGAMTATEVQQKYTNTGVADIYTYFGISSTDISSLGDTAVAGQVTKTGDVIVDGTTVATDAQTAGRTDITGSKQVSQGTTTFYTRTPAISFLDDKLDAFVVMHDSQFEFAILASCGNPVSATSKLAATPTPAPTPAPTAPTPTPSAPATPTPATTKTTQPTTPATDSNLPNTGAGSVLGVAAGVVIAATAAHQLIARRRLFSL